MVRRLAIWGFLTAASLPAVPALAATYQVGPDRATRELTALPVLAPGDIVELDGNAAYQPVTFTVDGTAARPITIRGLPVDGKRPTLRGGDYTLILEGDYYTVENVEVTGGTEVCIFNKAANTTIRNAQIHDCTRHGILGADFESGSLTLSSIEVFHTGGQISGENLKHPIYIATDEAAHPGSVFRLEHSWVHDNNGGNSVKTRSERNEIYYNWIENGPAQFYVLELIGPEADLAPPREDSDVVGNVLINASDIYAVRVGSDGSGTNAGRHRFVNNTFVLSAAAGGLLRVFQETESVEFYNNVFLRMGAPWSRFLNDDEAVWANGRNVRGANNWISDNGSPPDVPAELTGMLTGSDAGFQDLSHFDFRPLEGSPLVNAGATTTTTTDNSPPRALGRPGFVPPLYVHEPAGDESSRMEVGSTDIGAYEFGSPTGSLGSRDPIPVDPGPGAPDGGGPVDPGPTVQANQLIGGCAAAPGTGGGAGAGLLVLLALSLRRRR